jgi:pimeloyl-ACP methyl ester carboxylesterase
MGKKIPSIDEYYHSIPPPGKNILNRAQLKISFKNKYLYLFLGIKRVMVLGFCIGGQFIWNLVKRAPDRIIGAVVSQPVGFRKEMPTYDYDNYMKGWGPNLNKQRPDLSTQMIDRFLQSMYGSSRADFVHSVPRDAVRACQSPILVMPDDSPPHPYVIAMESAMLAPKSEVSMYPWKDTPDKIPLAVRQARTFLRVYRPTA